MVPFLNDVLSTTLSNMKATKKENLRYAYASALSRFSEAILDYEANIQDAPDQSVHKMQFKQEFDSAHEILFSRYKCKSGLVVILLPQSNCYIIEFRYFCCKRKPLHI